CESIVERGMKMRNVLETARKFGVTADDFFRYVTNFKGLGFTKGTVTRVLETSPRSFMLNEDEIRNKVDFVTKIGVRRGEIDRNIRLKPLLDEFRDLGFSPNEVRREVLREPKVVGLENGELSHCVEMLRNLKCRAAIKDIIFRNEEFRAEYKAKLRIDYLRKHGLIHTYSFTVLRKEPRVVLYEVGDIEKKTAFVVNTMKFDIQCIVEVPEYLWVNFEKQMVPRFNVIEYLRSSDGLGDEVYFSNSVATMYDIFTR
ncbi:hypothetical protein MIMGU_mgv1a018044mg, partial [Erythranthe guttata]